jgi:predicted dehydrogenase
MASRADLHTAVAAAIAGGRIGTPVFARYILHTSDTNFITPIFDHRCTTLAEWLPGGLEYSCGIRDKGNHASFLLQADQALALFSAARNGANIEAADVTVLGTRGAMYFPAEFPLQCASGACIDAPLATPKGKQEYGVLLVTGAHTHQEDYARDFISDPRCRIVAVSDEKDVSPRRRQLNEQLAVTLGVPYLPDLDEALQRADVHIVSICAEPERRGRIAVKCAEAGKHLYLDKPLAPRLEQARAVADAVRRAGVRSQMFSFVTAPWAADPKRLIDSGSLGKIQAIHADTFFAKGHAGTVTQPKVRREEFPPERHQLMDAKRELDNIGVYPITLIRRLTGRDFASLHARTANFFFAEHERRNVEDFGVIVGTLEGGIPVTIAAGRIGWCSHPAGGVNRLILIGSRRTIVVDANRPRFDVYAAEPPWTPPPAHPEDPMAFWTSTQVESGYLPKQNWIAFGGAGSDVKAFLDAIDTGKASDVSADDAAKATEVLWAAYKSAATGSLISLPFENEPT